ncbi:hypothetical protein LT493_04840 [Streptomyces tricolor]|nr:hypothetical protein [Streptomyces tricolor]
MENTRGVLLLSHVGFSFVEDLVAAVTRAGAEDLRAQLTAGTGAPGAQGPRRWRTSPTTRPGERRARADPPRRRGPPRPSPGRGRVGAVLPHRLGGLPAPDGTGQRPSGVPDLDDKQVLQLRDKLTLRNRLADAGLSRARATVLTPRRSPHAAARACQLLRQAGQRHRLLRHLPPHPGTTWEDLERIAAEARADTVYRQRLHHPTPTPTTPQTPAPRTRTPRPRTAAHPRHTPTSPTTHATAHATGQARAGARAAWTSSSRTTYPAASSASKSSSSTTSRTWSPYTRSAR